ncbi:uncharacterized protein Dana_GF21752 [Drosophila ananassae]|uniref:Ketimine reductase mu-crystallin n=1 Tax=Drosophila ananassae TaxID=7217 RepID=B3N0C2_DROAN|nr:uncharacterized protein Dana_GF21752 [Drosophila ananassae]
MSDTTPAYYGADAVGPFLTWPLVNEAVESALKAVVKSSPALTAQPRRTFTPIGSQSVQDQGLLLTMPAFVGNYETSSRGGSSTLACKLVTSFSGNAQRQPPLPSILAHVLVFSHQTGQLAAIMEATDLTTRRTVAASLVSTKYLYFRRFGPDAEVTRPITVAIVGCGVQGQMHALAFCQSFRVRKLLCNNRSRAKAEELAKLIGLEVGGQAVEVCESSREACHEADVICVATFAKEPLIHSQDLKPSGGVHINAVGAGEIHFSEVAPSVYRRSKVYVDCYANAEAELVGLPAPITAEVGEVILSKDYPKEQDITVFQSMGMASEDACVAQAVLDAISAGKDKDE